MFSASLVTFAFCLKLLGKKPLVELECAFVSVQGSPQPLQAAGFKWSVPSLRSPHRTVSGRRLQEDTVMREPAGAGAVGKALTFVTRQEVRKQTQALGAVDAPPASAT